MASMASMRKIFSRSSSSLRWRGGRAAQQEPQYDSDDEDEMQKKEARWKGFLLDIVEDKVRPNPTPNKNLSHTVETFPPQHNS